MTRSVDQRGVKGIRKVCQLMERCGFFFGRFKEMWEGVTVVRKCDSPQQMCQLVGRWDCHWEKGDWAGVTVDRRFDTREV